MDDRAYRDGSAALRERLDALRAEVSERRARLLPAFWRAAPVDVADRLKTLEQALPQDDDPRALLAAIDALEQYGAALDEAIRRVAPHEGQDVVSDAVVPMPRLELPFWSTGSILFGGPVGGDVSLEDTLRRGAERTTPMRYDVEPIEEDGIGRYARVTCKAARFAIASAPAYESGRKLHDAQVAIAARVPPGAPPVTLRGETWGDNVMKSVGLQRDVEVGDDRFDQTFLIHGDDEARALFSPDVRAALLRIAQRDVPHLAIEDGVALVRFRWEPELTLVDAAIEALLGVRNAPSARRLVR